MPTINQTIKKMLEFENFPQGWNFGSGVPLSSGMFNRGLSLLNLAEIGEIERSNAFLGDDGELQITIHHNNYTIAFTLEVDGTVSVTDDENGRILSQMEGLTDKQAQDILWETAQQIQNTSELLTINTIGMKKTADFLALPLDRLQTINAFQSLNLIVPQRQAAQSANTLKGFTQMWRATRSSFGKFQTGHFPTTALSNKVLSET